MAIQKQLGFGRTGWHGDQSLSLRDSLVAARALANELKADHNALVAALDTETSTYQQYVANFATVAQNVTSPVATHVAVGGSYTHGDDGVKLARLLSEMSTLANELKADHNNLLVQLDAENLDVSDYNTATYTVSGTNMPTIPPHFAAGGGGAHGDMGVRVRQALEGAAPLLNEIKAKHNLIIAKLQADSTLTDYAGDYQADFAVTTADA